MSSSRPQRQVVALRYRPEHDNAPSVVAKGQGVIAEQILQLAEQHNIPVRQDKNLLTVLSQLELDQEIPPEVYRVVAELMAFIYQLASKR